MTVGQLIECLQDESDDDLGRRVLVVAPSDTLHEPEVGLMMRGEEFVVIVFACKCAN